MNWNVQEIQKELRKEGIDGWLLYDFRMNNRLACKMLKIPPDSHLTRRFFYWIPSQGDPEKIVHAVETHVLEHLEGKERSYSEWEELESHLKKVLNGQKRIAMEYSARCSIPYVSMVDAGTVELVRSCGCEVVSSADVLQQYTSVLSDKQMVSQREAAKVCDTVVDAAWEKIREHLGANKPISEFQVQQFLLEQFANAQCVTESAPICAVNDHSANPHYCPSGESSSRISKKDFILVDLWCKKEAAGSIYGDITRVAVAAPQPTPKQQQIFDIVKAARNAATEWLRGELKKGNAVLGWQVDEKARNVIDKTGFGQFFVHRTGHSIGEHTHGDGANIDNFETHDTRRLLQNSCFSIEPGIYLPGEFGVRLEYDVLVKEDWSLEITGGVQEQIVCLM